MSTSIGEGSPACFLLLIGRMKARPAHAREQNLARIEAIARFQHSLDNAYHRIREAACQHWGRDFANQPDPSDACVVVRVTGFNEQSQHVRGAGILRTRPSPRKTGSTLTAQQFAV